MCDREKGTLEVYETEGVTSLRHPASAKPKPTRRDDEEDARDAASRSMIEDRAALVSAFGSHRAQRGLDRQQANRRDYENAKMDSRLYDSIQ